MLKNSRSAVIGMRTLDVEPACRQIARASGEELPRCVASRTKIRDGLERLKRGHTTNCNWVVIGTAECVIELPQLLGFLAIGLS